MMTWGPVLHWNPSGTSNETASVACLGGHER
jgi:hypothetical protein